MALPFGRCRVKEILKLRGKSQADLALYLDVTEGYVSRVCNDEETLSVINWKRTSEFLDCWMDQLMCFDQIHFKKPLNEIRNGKRGSELL